VQPENGLTVLGVRVLAVTIPTLYLWLTVNTSWCALLFLALLIPGIRYPDDDVSPSGDGAYGRCIPLF